MVGCAWLVPLVGCGGEQRMAVACLGVFALACLLSIVNGRGGL